MNTIDRERLIRREMEKLSPADVRARVRRAIAESRNRALTPKQIEAREALENYLRGDLCDRYSRVQRQFFAGEIAALEGADQ